MEVDFHLVKGEVHLDGVFQLEMQLAARVRYLNIGGLNRQIELAGTSDHSGTKPVVRHPGGFGI